MSERVTLKQQLPYPYNQDLSQVLRRLNRRTEFGRQGLANDPVTAAYLAAAMRLVERNVGLAGAPSCANAVCDEVGDRSLLAFLSQRAVANEMKSNPHPFPRCGNVSTMRSIWETRSDFIEDLLSYALWAGYYPESYQQTRAEGAERLAGTSPLPATVTDLSFQVTMALQEAASFRLQLIAIASADGNEAVRRILAAKYQRAHAAWRDVYGQMLTERGLRLRAGITLDQITVILTSTVEGNLLRSIADPSAEILDQGEGASLLGTAALAILNGCVVPIGDPDSRSLAESLEDKTMTRLSCDGRV